MLSVRFSFRRSGCGRTPSSGGWRPTRTSEGSGCGPGWAIIRSSSRPQATSSWWSTPSIGSGRSALSRRRWPTFAPASTSTPPGSGADGPGNGRFGLRRRPGTARRTPADGSAQGARGGECAGAEGRRRQPLAGAPSRDPGTRAAGRRGPLRGGCGRPLPAACRARLDHRPARRHPGIRRARAHRLGGPRGALGARPAGGRGSVASGRGRHPRRRHHPGTGAAPRPTASGGVADPPAGARARGRAIAGRRARRDGIRGRQGGRGRPRRSRRLRPCRWAVRMGLGGARGGGARSRPPCQPDRRLPAPLQPARSPAPRPVGLPARARRAGAGRGLRFPIVSRPVRVGLKLVPMWTTLADIRQAWRTADEAGFDHAWTFDHLNPTEGGVEGPVFDGWSLLAAAAETTKRVRIGCMVTGNTYRNPGQLAKLATTVDHLSGGRLEFGIGAGWAEAEHATLGLPFPSRGQRIRQLGEAVAIIRALWSGKPVDFEGRYYRVSWAIQQPVPLQLPAPPVWIGGAGEKLTLRLVAEQ